MTKAIVLLSGGIDSAVCLAHAAENHDKVHPIHFDYGQQTEGIEWRMAMEQLDHMLDEFPDTKFTAVGTFNYKSIFKHFAEGVASDRDTFLSEDGELEEEDGRSTGYVPMRNLHFIATGAALADHIGGDVVYHGAQGGDEESYPDCRPRFMTAARAAIDRSTPEGVTIRLATPLLKKTKVEVLEMGEDLGVAWEYTYSCYKQSDEPEPCGECPACVERVEAFEAAGLEDPHA